MMVSTDRAILLELSEPLEDNLNTEQETDDRIHDIQGTGLTSLLVGEIVENIPGIVTAVANNGFYLQDPNPDDNLLTSEGIFVFTRSQPTVSIGDAILVSGTVSEFQPGGSTTNNLTITQITNPTITVLSTGNELPEATLIGEEGRTPPSEIISPDGINFYESLEGMRVTVQNAVAVSPTNNFGEIWTLSEQGEGATGVNSRGGITISENDFNPESIQIDDAFLGLSSPKVNVGDLLGDVTGVVSYAFGNYEVLVTEVFTPTSGELQREVTELMGTAERLTIASYNVENLNPDAGERFEAIAEQIINPLKSPDIIALQEIQDNNGPINDGTVAADLTYQALIDAISGAGGPNYEFLNIDPENNQDGGQPGGNIRVGYLYNPERVSFVEGSLRRITDPDLSDGDAFEDSRKPLVATFEFNGQEITAINNHFTSRSGSSPLFGNVQPPLIAGEEQRNAQAQVVSDEVDTLLADDANANIIVLGDFNGFDFEEHLEILKSEVLTNLNETLPVEERYTFNFQGNSQALDHLLISNHLVDDAEYDIVHINADFTDQQTDHDPLIVELDLSNEPSNFTLQLLHASDFEAGLEALDDAPRFSAVINGLRDDFANTLILSSGDNYIPSPFLFAAGDPALNATAVGRAGLGRADITILNEIGIQASAFGNHEFDLGTREVQGLIRPDGAYRGTLFPYLSANLDFSTDSNLSSLVTADGQEASTIPNKIAASTVITVNGEKIGIVGATTPTLRQISSPGGVTVLPLSATDYDALAAEIQASVDALTATGINKIILLAHMQQLNIERDELAPRLKDVDVIVAGGSHTLLSDETDRLRLGDTSGGTYPFFKTDAEGNPIAIVNTDANYRYVGRLVIEFDEEGNIIPDSYDPDISGAYATDAAGVAAVGGTPDPEVVQITDTLRQVINQQDGNIFGKTDVFLRGDRAFVRTEETNLGNLTADANLAAAKAVDSSTVISIKNGGGIRSNIGVISASGGSTDPNDFELLPPAANPSAGKEEGEISQLDISNALRFNNGLSLLTLSAAQLKQTLEHGVRATVSGATPGQFPQVSGLVFSFDPDLRAAEDSNGNGILDTGEDTNNNGVLDAGERVRSLTIVNENGQIIDVVVGNGQLVGNPNRTFRTVTLGFLAGGGDSYPFLTFPNTNRVDLAPASGNNFTTSGSEQDALADYLVANFSEMPFSAADVAPELDTRIQNLNFREDTVIPRPPLPKTVFGTSGDDIFDSVAPDGKRFEGDNQILFSGSGDDSVDVTFAPGGNRIDTGSGNDFIFAGTNNRIIAGIGDDLIFVGTGGGNNLITGGLGTDQFWIVTDEGDLPTTFNTITDFNLTAGDVIGFGATSLDFASLNLVQNGLDTLIQAFDRDLAKLSNIQATTLNESAFVFA